MTHDIPSEGRPSAVTGQPETPVASRVDERDCSRPAAAAPGAAEGKSAAPGISPADHPLGIETPEQAARYWQLRHAEAAIEIAQAKHRNLKLQAELAAVSKRHVDAAIETQQDLKSLTAARAEVERLKAALAEEKRLHAAAEEARRCAIATLAGCHELVDQAAIPGLERDRMQSLQVRISGLIERATKPLPVAPPPAEVERLKADLAEEKRERAKWGAEARTAMATLRECHELIDKTAIPRLEHTRMLSIQDRIRFLLELATKPLPVAPPPAEVERLKADLAEEKRERAEWESAARDARAMLIQCHELIDKAAIPSVMLGRMQGLQGCIRALLELAAKPVHVVPPPADTASCEQHLQERIEELEAELKAARAEIADVHRGLDATGVYAQVTTLSGQRLLSPRERIDRLTARAVELADCINAPASKVGVYGRMASAICGVTYGGIGLRCAPEAADPHPALDSIHAALDRADVPREEVAETPPRTRPKTPQSRIESLAADRDAQRGLVERLSKDCELLNWLDRVGDLVVLNLRVGPVCVKRGATGAHKTLRAALEAIRIGELDDLCRRAARQAVTK